MLLSRKNTIYTHFPLSAHNKKHTSSPLGNKKTFSHLIKAFQGSRVLYHCIII